MATTRRLRMTLLAVGITINIVIIIYFKYTNFIVNIINDLRLGAFPAMDILVPVGVSFYVFSAISYIIDVYRHPATATRSKLDLLCYVSFFPKLLAGPIERATKFIPQLRNDTILTKEDVGKAMYLIIAGLFKKAVIADYIGLNFVDRVFQEPTRYSGIENLFAVYGYSMQLYCDFSGYSDMAVGIALMLGYRLMDNFDSPYSSSSITEFWSRWHISLSTWLRDYLYISLGGNRYGKLKQCRNIIITMLLCGLWHGASYNFLVWGLLHGTLLSLERFVKIPYKLQSYKTLHILRIVLTFHFVSFCWIFFRAASLTDALNIVRQIVFYFNGSLTWQLITGYSTVFVLLGISVLSHLLPKGGEQKLVNLLTRMPLSVKAMLLLVAIWVTLQIRAANIQPFIYFQF